MLHPTGARARKRTPNRHSAHLSGEALFDHHRIRLHAGVLLALALIGLLAFVVFPLRQYRVQVDGVDRTLRSRQSGTNALLAQAQVQMLGGDEARRERGPDGDSRVAVERALPVVLEVDGQRLAWRTRARTVEGALAEAGFLLGRYDTVTLNGIPADPRDAIDVPQSLVVARALSVRLPAGAMEAPAETGAALVVRRAVPFTLRDGDTVRELSSGEATVGLALRQAGVPIGPGDLLDPPPGKLLAPGLEVAIQRARPVSLSIAGSRVLLYTRAHTVGELLEEAGVGLASDQRVYPPAETAVPAGEEVRIVNVSDETYVESETVEHSTVYRIDPSLADGETRRVPGGDGVVNREYRIHYEDGQEVHRELNREWSDPEPVNTIVYYAGGARFTAAGLPDGLNVVRTLRVYTTWYNPASAGKSPSSPGYGVTASGATVTYGIVAVDPGVIPLGTRMYIPGYGYAVAADTGGAVVGNIIDLGFPDGVSPNWTPGWIEIYILGP